MEKISAVYKIVNTVTGETYIGSSKDVKKRWTFHKSLSTWKRYANSLLYQDFQKYGLDKFDFEIIEETDDLKNREQYFISLLSSEYNIRVATTGLSREDYNKQYYKEYKKSEKWKESNRKASRKYRQTEKGKESNRRCQSQLCSFKGETLTLNALCKRFQKDEIEHPWLEAKKYLVESY